MDQGDVPLVSVFANGQRVYLNVVNADSVLKITATKSYYIFGDVFYWRDGQKARMVNNANQSALTQIFKAKNIADIVTHLEGQYVGVCVDSAHQTVTLFSDRYARKDVFYTKTSDALFAADDMDFIVQNVGHTPIDPKMLAHMTAVYGWYAPKGYTLYRNILRPRVGEILTFKGKSFQSAIVAFKPLEVRDYGEPELKNYELFLRESIASRVGNEKGPIWVSSSSGWDSSIILGLLVDMYGAKRIRMMVGSMQYSAKTGLINRFEIEKIKKIGAFYGIKPSTVNLDFKNKSALGFWNKIIGRIRSKGMYSLTSFNFARIADAIAMEDAPGRVVFNGETSDSFHNFGFSQFVTFFHTEKSFTEYGDKMNCYLYSPSFFKKVMDGSFMKDRVYQIFLKMNPGVSFDHTITNRADVVEKYFLPLFYGGPRLPFADTISNPGLSARAVREVRGFLGQEYMPALTKTLKPENLYSWIIHLYLSMHSQGSTVNIHKHAMELNNHRWRSPFNDTRLIDLLSQAPESWGRGLDFNHTKHPLKWVAKHRIKFPYELLEQGAHSYLYDVIEGFSLIEEIIYRSSFAEYYKELLLTRSYRELFDNPYFEMKYWDRLASDFIAGKSLKGKDFANLFSLVTYASTGWYKGKG